MENQQNDEYVRLLRLQYSNYREIKKEVRKYHRAYEASLLSGKNCSIIKPRIYLEDTALFKTKQQEFNAEKNITNTKSHYQYVNEFLDESDIKPSEMNVFLKTICSWCNSPSNVTPFYTNLSLSKRYPDILRIDQSFLSHLRNYNTLLSSIEKKTLCKSICSCKKIRIYMKEMLLSSIIMKSVSDLSSRYLTVERNQNGHTTPKMNYKTFPKKRRHHLSFSELAINVKGSQYALSCFEINLKDACDSLNSDLSDYKSRLYETKKADKLLSLFIPFFSKSYSPVSCGIMGNAIINEQCQKGLINLSETFGIENSTQQNNIGFKSDYGYKYYILLNPLDPHFMIYTDVEEWEYTFETETNLYYQHLNDELQPIINTLTEDDPDYLFDKALSEILGIVNPDYNDIASMTNLEEADDTDDYLSPDHLDFLEEE